MWHLFWISAPAELRDSISGFLPGIGSTGVMEQEGKLGAFFPPGGASPQEIRAALERILDALRSEGLKTADVSIEYEPVEERDWNEAWKKDIRPISLDCGIVIAPPWLERDSSITALHLIIDPGSAFGTGHHETTADCLCAIRRHVREALDVSPMFADLGAGTGLLAILAAREGFRSVVAIDHDPDAVSAAIHNAELNRVSDTVRVRRGSIESLPGGCGMIAANLFAGLLKDYMGRISEALSVGGILVASGMLEGQDSTVAESMKEYGVDLLERTCRERWVTLVGVKAPDSVKRRP